MGDDDTVLGMPVHRDQKRWDLIMLVLASGLHRPSKAWTRSRSALEPVSRVTPLELRGRKSPKGKGSDLAFLQPGPSHLNRSHSRSRPAKIKVQCRARERTTSASTGERSAHIRSVAKWGEIRSAQLRDAPLQPCRKYEDRNATVTRAASNHIRCATPSSVHRLFRGPSPPFTRC